MIPTPYWYPKGVQKGSYQVSIMVMIPVLIP